MPRRRGFDVRIWRAKCKCKHSHEDHDPNRLSCRECACHSFQSAWLCTVCEGKWEDHESLWESEQERMAEGKPVGQAFFPLSSTPQIQDIAFKKAPGEGPRSFSLPHNPRPERSVRLMQERCPHYGGRSSGSAAQGGGGGGFGSLEDAFPPQQQQRGSWDDEPLPARRQQNPMGSLEDAFPPARQGAGPRPGPAQWGEAPASGRGSPFGASRSQGAAARSSALARSGQASRAIADVSSAGPASAASGAAGAGPPRRRPPSGGQRPPSGGQR